jgi:hypothetical protein
LLNEFDVDPNNPTLARDRFHTNYLAISQNGQPALNYPHRYSALSNTGVPTGATTLEDGDFDNNGQVVSSYAANASTTVKNNYGNDCFGFGWFPGQYSFVVFSKYPIAAAQIRTFRQFLWKDLPNPNWPDDSSTPAAQDYYTSAEKNIFRLSSKNHVDLPIELRPGHLLHLLCSHPTPPAFDGLEDRNGRRNYDEIRLWADYINNRAHVKDDTGVFGGLDDDQRFVILGDLNADPVDGDSFTTGGVRAINQLRNHPRVNASFNPASLGGPQQSTLQGGVNNSHQGNPAFDTADFFDGSGGAGNLRVDHLLPSKAGLNPLGGGVFWPLNTDPTFALIAASDHRLVWMDLAVVPVVRQAVRELQSAAQGQNAVITWRTQQGVTYQVERSSDLAAWSSTPAIPIFFDADLAIATDAGGLGSLPQFYRIITTLEAPAPAPLLGKKPRAMLRPGAPARPRVFPSAGR